MSPMNASYTITKIKCIHFMLVFFLFQSNFFLLCSHVSSTSCHETDEACVQDTGPSPPARVRQGCKVWR